MASATDIIDLLDGSAAVGRETGTPLTTIEGWKEVNYIPVWRHPALLDLAARTNKPLAHSDFPSAAERRPRARLVSGVAA